MRRTIGLAVASVILGAGTAVALPAAAQAAPASEAITVKAYTWQYTGEYYSAESTCKARRSYFMAASNVKDYRCVRSNGLWAGQVYAS